MTFCLFVIVIDLTQVLRMLSIRRTSSSTDERSSTTSTSSASSGTIARLFLDAFLHPTPFTGGRILRRTIATRSRTRRTDFITRWSVTVVRRRPCHAHPNSAVVVVVSVTVQQTSSGRSCRLWRLWRRHGVKYVYIPTIAGRHWQFCRDENIVIGWLQALSSIRKECFSVILKQHTCTVYYLFRQICARI